MRRQPKSHSPMKKKQNKSVRASALQIILALALLSISAILLAATFASPGSGARVPGTEEPSAAVPAIAIEKIVPAVFNGDVRDLPQVPQTELVRPELQAPFNAKQLLPEAQVPQTEAPNIPLAPMPSPIRNFPGITRTDTCTGGQCGTGPPPDTNGAVGPNHYIQAVNSAFAIYNKSGTLLASFTENALWAGTGAPQCDGHAGGDPLVIYDALADRWILTNLAFTGNGTTGPFYECIAVSQTSDPVSGGWYLYPIRTDTGAAGQPPVNTLNDYPKFGIWMDCLYYSANGFNSAGSFIGGEFASFSRSDMYAGLPVTGALGFASSTNDFFTMLPSNLEAPIVGTYNGVPPAGRPNFYVQESLTAFNFRVRTFTAGSNCGSGGTLSPATTVSQTSYTVFSSDIVPQPGTTNTLDSIDDRMMQKNQYRKVGSAESLWVVHTFRSSGSGPTGSQWAQINVTGGTIATTPVQQQLYNPADGIYRWMGSIATDIQGNVALGYSTSNGTNPNFPSIAYSGRLASDPINMLPQTETQLIAGAGSQTGPCGGTCHRWGDYSSMSIDPSDGCTFWYTTEYFTSASNGGNSPPIWSSRIGSFKFPSCAAATPTPTPTPTATPTPAPIVQVTVQTSPTGLTFSVDGTTYSSTQTFSWASGSSHTIATTSPQSGGSGVRYVWSSWTGGGAISHTVAPTTNKTYTATFRTQYYLTMTHGTGGTVTPASGWKNSGSAVSISATPTNNTQVSYRFDHWTGTGAGSYSGTNNPASITMNGPITENATFIQNPVQVSVQTNPSGRTFSVDGTTYSLAQTFSWNPGSSHTIATTSPQNGSTGVRYVWSNWSGGGAISHSVAPTTNKTYTATFSTQYYLTMSHGTGGTVTPASGWRGSGTTVSITATPASGYSFTNWTGSGTGSFSGTNNPASITMGGPITETATFTHN
jgi:Divergent InlB B-repeat domain